VGAATFIGLQYLQLVRGDTPLLEAVQVLPLALALMPASRLAARLTARYGARKVGGVGLVLIAGGLAIIAQVGTDSAYLLMAAGLVVLGIGLGMATTPATSSITETLPASQQGVGSALNDLSREVGGALGIAVIGSILTSTYSSHVNVAGLSSQLAAKVKSSYALASQAGPPISDRAHTAFVSGMHTALIAAAAVALIAAVVALTVLARRPKTTPASQGAAVAGAAATTEAA
jgi:MFS family permease